MNKFILDLVHDLRMRKLWPVAVVLVAALVAVPLLLKKSPHTQPAPTTATPTTAADAKPVVALAPTTTVGSNLRVFDNKNPFKPNLPKAKAASTAGTGATGSSGATSGSGGSSGSGSGGSTDNSGSGGGTNSGGTTPKTTAYTYTVDLKFGKRDATRTHHNVQKLDLLPSSSNPLIVFMGVNTDADTAIFLIDTSLKASGEGDCKPSPDVCSFLYLKLDSQSDTEDLLAENADGTGTEYTLQLLDINKVKVADLASASAKPTKQEAADARRLRNKPGTPFHFLFKLPQPADGTDG
jgi:hypothetical protein